MRLFTVYLFLCCVVWATKGNGSDKAKPGLGTKATEATVTKPPVWDPDSTPRNLSEMTAYLRGYLKYWCKPTATKLLMYKNTLIETPGNKYTVRGKVEAFAMTSDHGLDEGQTGTMFRLRIDPKKADQEYQHLKYLYNLHSRLTGDSEAVRMFGRFVDCFYQVSPTGPEFLAVAWVIEDRNKSFYKSELEDMKIRYRLAHFLTIAKAYKTLYLLQLRNIRLDLDDVHLNDDFTVGFSAHQLGQMSSVLDGFVKSDLPSSSRQYEIISIDDFEHPDDYFPPSLERIRLTPEISILEEADVYNLRMMFFRVMGVPIDSDQKLFAISCGHTCLQQIFDSVKGPADATKVESLLKYVIKNLFVEKHNNMVSLVSQLDLFSVTIYSFHHTYKCEDASEKGLAFDLAGDRLVPGSLPTELVLLFDLPLYKFDLTFMDRYLDDLPVLNFYNRKGVKSYTTKANQLSTVYGNTYTNLLQSHANMASYEGCVFSETALALRFSIPIGGKLVRSIREVLPTERLGLLRQVIRLVRAMVLQKQEYISVQLKDLLFFDAQGKYFAVIHPKKLREFVRAGQKREIFDRETFCRPSELLVESIPPEAIPMCRGDVWTFNDHSSIWSFGQLILSVVLPNHFRTFLKRDAGVFSKISDACKVEKYRGAFCRILVETLQKIYQPLPEKRILYEELIEELVDMDGKLLF